jgi:RNA polymerase sigma-70 factor (family 1)
MASYDLTTEKALLQEISMGNSGAFATMFNLYKGRILSFVDSFVHDRADSEEIVQETFMVIWQNREKLQLIEHPRNYIYTIARNKTYDYLTKINKSEKSINSAWISTTQTLNNIDEQINLKESLQLIDNVLHKMSPQKQMIFKMSRYQYMSHEEIANSVGLSKSRVKNVIVEVLKHLKYHVNRSNMLLLAYTISSIFI